MDQTFQKSRQFVLVFLQKELAVSHPALTILHFYNYKESDAQSKLATIQPVKQDNIKDFINQFDSIFDAQKKQELLIEIDHILPKQAFIFSNLNVEHFGITLDCQQICINESLFNFYYEDMMVTTIGFVLLNEICHLKKDIFQRNNLDDKTPEVIKKIQEDIETGDLLDYSIFDRELDIDVLSSSPELCKKFADVANLSNSEFEELKKIYKNYEDNPKSRRKVKTKQTGSTKYCYRRYYRRPHDPKKPIAPFSG